MNRPDQIELLTRHVALLETQYGLALSTLCVLLRAMTSLLEPEATELLRAEIRAHVETLDRKMAASVRPDAVRDERVLRFLAVVDEALQRPPEDHGRG